MSHFASFVRNDIAIRKLLLPTDSLNRHSSGTGSGPGHQALNVLSINKGLIGLRCVRSLCHQRRGTLDHVREGRRNNRKEAIRDPATTLARRPGQSKPGGQTDGRRQTMVFTTLITMNSMGCVVPIGCEHFYCGLTRQPQAGTATTKPKSGAAWRGGGCPPHSFVLLRNQLLVIALYYSLLMIRQERLSPPMVSVRHRPS